MKRVMACAIFAGLLVGCADGDAPDFTTTWEQTTSRVRTDSVRSETAAGTIVHNRPYLRDAQNRYTHIRGLNVSGSHKAPPSERGNFPLRYPWPEGEDCSQIPLSQACLDAPKIIEYIGSPFPEEDADRWFGEMAALGFNSVRLITNWESIQPHRPESCPDDPRYSQDGDCLDLEYLDYYEGLIEVADRHGIYVLLDMHQDVFSRHLMVYYNEDPKYLTADGEVARPEEGTIEHFILSLFPNPKSEGGAFTDWVRGHGAPRWVVENCLPEKNLDSPNWGMFRALGQLYDEDGTADPVRFGELINLYTKLNPDGDLSYPPWFLYLTGSAPTEGGLTPEDDGVMTPKPFDLTETSDFLPVAPWLINGAASMDVDRCFAALFAGDEVFPNLIVDETGTTRVREDGEDALPDLKAYLQGHYETIWRAVAKRGAKYDNVIGYDVMNEPVGVFLMITMGAIMAQTDGGWLSDEVNPVRLFLDSFVGEALGKNLYDVMKGLNLLPLPEYESLEDGSLEADFQGMLDEWGLAHIDAGAVLGLNTGFDGAYLEPFFARMGVAIEEEDPNAIIWIEPSSSVRTVTGPSAFWDQPLTRPQGPSQIVFAPHWYPDIYPFPGIFSTPREFNPDEWLYRDFKEPLHHYLDHAPNWLGNAPVIFGEFGTYFNFQGDEDNHISSHVLNSYYEAFEALNVGSMLWCFSAENDAEYGEHWNHEDFSIIGPDQKPRGVFSYVRPYARATSGKQIRQSFHSPYHYWDPVEGEHPTHGEYVLEMETAETDAATEIFVPDLQYPDGYYVWLSDGAAYLDAAHQLLLWYPSTRAAGGHHWLKIAPVRDDIEAQGWSYLFQDGMVVTGAGDPSLYGAEVAQ